jgi:hypothetical protein
MSFGASWASLPNDAVEEVDRFEPILANIETPID